MSTMGEGGKDPRQGHQFDTATESTKPHGGKFLNEAQEIFIIMALKSGRK